MGADGWRVLGGVTGGCCIPSLQAEPHKQSRAECCSYLTLTFFVQLPDCVPKKYAASMSGIISA